MHTTCMWQYSQEGPDGTEYREGRDEREEEAEEPPTAPEDEMWDEDPAVGLR